MLISAIFLLCILAIYVVFNYRNKFTYVLALYFFSIAAMMVVAVLYISKSSSYQFPIQMDYNLYLRLSTVKIPVRYIARMYDFCMAVFMISSVTFIKVLNKLKWRSTVLFILPVAYFIIWNDWAVSRRLYLLINTGTAEAAFWTRVAQVGTVMNQVMILSYLLLPFIYLALYYRKTAIGIKQKYAVVIGVCILLIDIFVYFIFIQGPFKPILFNHVDFVKLPSSGAEYSGYIVAPVILLLTLLTVILLTLYYKPFDSFTIIRKKEIMQNTRMLNKNLSMILHVYKNGFLAVGQQFDLVKMSFKKERTEDALPCAETGLKIVEDYLSAIDKTLQLLRNMQVTYRPVGLNECIRNALAKVALPAGIRLDLAYAENNIVIYGDEYHLTESFVNMFINSVEAMRNSPKPHIKVGITQEEDLCIVEITDNGCGIEKKEIRNIFKPFYSTKPRRKSGGVGLNYVDNVIRQHHGTIMVTSKAGEFTCFQIVLPIYKKKKGR